MSTQAATRPTTGISAIGLSLPRWGLPVEELARLRGVDPGKYTRGLGCHTMALCAPDEDVVDLAEAAARRALQRWGGDLGRIGLIAIGTETAADMSRPLSAWVADRLGLRGAVRSYEVKHACYGGTLALRQAVEWKMSGAAADRAALVIAADVALYKPEDPGEPTQGAGAVAMVVDKAQIASVDIVSHAWSEPEFDFWRPVGESFPRVEGPLSLDCYKRATEHCFRAFVDDREVVAVLADLAAVCFHVPFPKMVRKAVDHLAAVFAWSEQEVTDFYGGKVEPTMTWNRLCGNAYTASLWISVASALRGLSPGQRVAAFSYGSGFGAELLTLVAGPRAQAGSWAVDIEEDLARQITIDADRYAELRGEAAAVTAA